ncbi:hypothetical protein [Pseudomonas sp. LjRoot263]|uniref:hypothetical protein n=1 Tax=Pseudomonas sp. LjRoot263 TaxID=3342302 RepID=UPI003F50C412
MKFGRRGNQPAHGEGWVDIDFHFTQRGTLGECRCGIGDLRESCADLPLRLSHRGKEVEPNLFEYGFQVLD